MPLKITASYGRPEEVRSLLAGVRSLIGNVGWARRLRQQPSAAQGIRQARGRALDPRREVVRSIIQQGAHLDKPAPDGTTALTSAVHWGVSGLLGRSFRSVWR
jgi:hypothetical protein